MHTVQVTTHWFDGVIIPSNWAGQTRPFRTFFPQVSDQDVPQLVFT